LNNVCTAEFLGSDKSLAGEGFISMSIAEQEHSHDSKATASTGN